MNIFLKAGNERIFEVPFQCEQLKSFDNQMNHLHFYKLTIDTKTTDLPFNQIIFTLPHTNDFESLLKAGGEMQRQQIMVNMRCPKLCINTFCKGEFLGSQFFDVMTGQYLVATQAVSEQDLVELQYEYKGLYVEKEGNQLPEPVLYHETVEAFIAGNGLNH